MDKEEYQSAVATCYIAAKMLALHDLPKILEMISRADSVGAILDPTLYRDKAPGMYEDKNVVNAALKLRKIGLRLTNKT